MMFASVLNARSGIPPPSPSMVLTGVRRHHQMPQRGSSQNPGQDCKSVITDIGVWFAWANIAVLELTMIWLRVNCDISSAMSASRITDSALLIS